MIWRSELCCVYYIRSSLPHTHRSFFPPFLRRLTSQLPGQQTNLSLQFSLGKYQPSVCPDIGRILFLFVLPEDLDKVVFSSYQTINKYMLSPWQSTQQIRPALGAAESNAKHFCGIPTPMGPSLLIRMRGSTRHLEAVSLTTAGIGGFLINRTQLWTPWHGRFCAGASTTEQDAGCCSRRSALV